MRKRAIAVALLLTASLVAGSAGAATETFRKWSTPDGSLYIGENPPAGSTLIEKVELPVSAREDGASTGASISRAAEDGRELMRQRAVEREAKRDRELARDIHEVEVVERTTEPVIVNRFLPIHRRHGRRPHDRDPRIGIGPSPLPRHVMPDTSWREFRQPSFRPPHAPFSRSFPTGDLRR